MDILIKFFNRPFYLDRCISSTYSLVEGDFEIKTLDDGTPKKYLDKIQNKFPKVKIITSKNYNQKVTEIKNYNEVRTKIYTSEIPVDLWISEVQNTSDFFLIIEDDVWFIDTINLNEINEYMKKYSIHLLKLGWNGGSRKSSKIKKINDVINKEIPILLSKQLKVINLIFKNKFKIYSILTKLKLVHKNAIYNYCNLISIAMGIHSKEYWLATWKNLENKVNEKQQIKNALLYYKLNNDNFLARYHIEILKTSFCSAATNSYHEYKINFRCN